MALVSSLSVLLIMSYLKLGKAKNISRIKLQEFKCLVKKSNFVSLINVILNPNLRRIVKIKIK